jgi:hypothetical protein
MKKYMGEDDFVEKTDVLFRKVIELGENLGLKVFLSYSVINKQSKEVNLVSSAISCTPDITNTEIMKCGTDVFSLIIDDIEANLLGGEEEGEIKFTPEA